MAKGIPGWLSALGQSALNAVANSPQAQAVQDGTPRRIMDQLGQWFGHLGQAALVEWSPSLVRNELCCFCDDGAIGRCMSCGDFTCLGHAHVSYRAELLCDECVGRVLEGSENAKHKTPEQLAFAYFNLTDTATLDEVKAVYRLRVQKAHPDKGGTDEEFNEATRAFRVLEEHYAKRKAA